MKVFRHVHFDVFTSSYTVVHAHTKSCSFRIQACRFHLLCSNLEDEPTFIVWATLAAGVNRRSAPTAPTGTSIRTREGDYCSSCDGRANCRPSTQSLAQNVPDNRPCPNILSPRIDVPPWVLLHIPIHARPVHQPQRVGLEVPPVVGSYRASSSGGGRSRIGTTGRGILAVGSVPVEVWTPPKGV